MMAAARRLLNRFQHAMVRIAEQPHTCSSHFSRKVGRGSAAGWTAPPSGGSLIRRSMPRRTASHWVGAVGQAAVQPSLDIPEHRQMLGTLRAAVSKLADGERRAKAEIAELEADRLWQESGRMTGPARAYMTG